jgi:hypothetical protein
VAEEESVRLKDFGFGMHELLRYGYAGLLAFALSGIIGPHWTEELVERLGKVVVPIVALVLGAALYIVYRHLLGETLIFWLGKQCHQFCDRKMKSTDPVDLTCKYRYLQGEPFKIARTNSQDAFRIIRDARTVGNNHVWNSFHREHSEIHVLYLTFFELLLLLSAGLGANISGVSGVCQLP